MVGESQNTETTTLTDAIHAISRGSAVISKAAMCALMVLVTLDVTGRYFFNMPVKGAFEVSEFMLVAIVAFSIAYTQAKQQHISAEIIVTRLPERAKIALEAVFSAVAVIFFFLIIVSSVGQTLHDLRTNHASEILHIPFFIVRMFIPLGSLIMIAELIITIKQKVARH